MENTIPSYLTKDFLKEALENGFKTPNIEVHNFTVSAALGKGENYTSEILRVGVNYKLPQQVAQHISLIVKNVQMEGVIEGVRSIDIVQSETKVYTQVIPQIELLFGNSFMIAPKYFAVDGEASGFVLADLNALGFELQDRVTGLDEAHCIVVMKKIAQLHAGSMYIFQKNPKYTDLFHIPRFNEYITVGSNVLKQMFENNFEQMIDVVKSWSGYEAILVKLQEISSNLLERGVEHCKRMDGELRVLNHGDLWLNNMMFKYDKDTKALLDVVFVDFQTCNYGSLGFDLNNFFNTSVQLEVLKSMRTELLKVYYDTLKFSLEQLNYSPIPSWDDVRKEVRAKEFYGLTMLGCVFPMVIMDKSASQNSTVENMHEPSKEKHDAMFASKRMVETLKYSLKRLDELGVLDE